MFAIGMEIGVSLYTFLDAKGREKVLPRSKKYKSVDEKIIDKTSDYRQTWDI